MSLAIFEPLSRSDRLHQNYKLNISFVKQNKNKYIVLEPKKYARLKFKWETRGKHWITPEVLEEVLKKWNEIEII